MPSSIDPKFKLKYDPECLSNYLANYLYNLEENSEITPFRLYIYPTALCNDSCRYCSDGLRGDSNSFDSHLKHDANKDFFSNRGYIDKLIYDIKELKIRDINLFGGGEPFFYKENMFYFLEGLKDTDVFIRIITNANNLSEKDVDYIVKNGLVSTLNISFNSDCEGTAKKLYLDSSRHRHSLSILEAILNCKNLYCTDFPKVNIMSILLNVNYNKIRNIINLVGRYRINYFALQHLRSHTNEQKKFMLTKEQERGFLRELPKIEDTLNKFKIFNNMSEFKVEEENLSRDLQSGNSIERPELKNKNNLVFKCYVPLTTLAICYNGNIPLCFFKYDKQYKHNYFDLDSLKGFINSQEYTATVKHLTDLQLPDICTGCQFCTFKELETLRWWFNRFKK